MADINGRAPVAQYDGYGSCPLTVERGKIVLAEFGLYNLSIKEMSRATERLGDVPGVGEDFELVDPHGGRARHLDGAEPNRAVERSVAAPGRQGPVGSDPEFLGRFVGRGEVGLITGR